ncbi:MAG TPA: hypothetical protein VJR92_16465, partial [Gemmatimonadaceae bacterium]|nr:hypothetical protein [Gemmatimonadaceae bacterium]
VIDRVSQTVSADSATMRVPLTFVPTATGTASLRVTAELGGARSEADVAVHIDEQRWGVLFFDRRPSWMSTFVRRALEDDPRFVVTSRIVTSRDVTTDAGRPPLSLAEYTPLAAFDAVVVGAPDALTARDVDGLNAFMRRRGGGVVFLFDNNTRGPYERITSVATWSSTPDGARADAIVGGPNNTDSTGLRAAELSWPAQLPLGAHAIGTASGRPVVWKSSVGSGTLVVSGAQDAWKYRGANFDSFWRATIGNVAASAPALLDVDADADIVAPGERIGINVTLREVALSRDLPLRVSVNATLESDSVRTPVQMWPGGAIGALRGTVRAPATPGTYNVVVTSAGARAELPIIVAENATRASPDDRDVVAAFAHSRGGVVAPSSQLSSMVNALDRAVTHQLRRETWYPMRSAWWIVPFALLLGAEWWWRRRRGHV